MDREHREDALLESGFEGKKGTEKEEFYTEYTEVTEFTERKGPAGGGGAGTTARAGTACRKLVQIRFLVGCNLDSHCPCSHAVDY